MFRSPRPLDLTATFTEPTPEHWLPYLQGEERQNLTFLPLVPGNRRDWPAGWCTYAEHLGDSPDVEILCGGMNSKLPSAAAVWRQGWLLHFGFEQEPQEMNYNGRALLENCIVYIARFTADQPLAETPSPFVASDYPKPRRYMLRAVQKDGAEPKDLAGFFADPPAAAIRAMTLPDVRAWVGRHQDYLCAGPPDLSPLGDGGRLKVDEDARLLGAPLGKQEFFAAVLSALGDPDRAARAVGLLVRRVPEGPGAEATAAAWRAFVTGNRPYLFFLEEGGYRWHVDPLARSRGVPCTELRGPARATSR